MKREIKDAKNILLPRKKVITKSGMVAYVTNQLADGTRRASMKGFVLEYNDENKYIYDLTEIMWGNALQRKREQEQLQTERTKLE